MACGNAWPKPLGPACFRQLRCAPRPRCGFRLTSTRWRWYPKADGTHQRGEAGSRCRTRQERGGHGLDRGPDRAAFTPDRRSDGASAGSREGSSLPPRPAQARRTAAPAPELHAEEKPGGLPPADQRPGPAPLRREAGSRRRKFEGAPIRVASNLRLRLSGRTRRQHMSMMVTGNARVATAVGRDEITFETGKLAKQADGSVLVRAGDTMVLATAMGRMEAREGADFFPLTVDVEERMYAAGKIPGGFFKREGRPTEKAILTARMIDRPIRPLWPKGFTNEVQVICTVLSADLVTAHDILCLNGASAALMLSPLPFMGPVGAVRVGRLEGRLVVNPTLPEVETEADLDLIVVGTKDALTMVEAGASEIPEDTLLEALELAHDEIKKLCAAQEELREKAGKPKWLDRSLTEELEAAHAAAIGDRIAEVGLREAGAFVDELQAELAPPLSMESTEEDVVR